MDRRQTRSLLRAAVSGDRAPQAERAAKVGATSGTWSNVWLEGGQIYATWHMPGPSDCRILLVLGDLWGVYTRLLGREARTDRHGSARRVIE